MSYPFMVLALILSLSRGSTGPIGKYFKVLSEDACVQVDWLNGMSNAAQQISLLVICGDKQDSITLNIKQGPPPHYTITEGSYAAHQYFTGYVRYVVCRDIIEVSEGDLMNFDYVNADNSVRTQCGPEPFVYLASGHCP